MSSGSSLEANSESPSRSDALELRQKQAQDARKEQIRLCYIWEETHGEKTAKKRRESKVAFEPEYLLTDAVNNLNQDEMQQILNAGLASPNMASEATGVSLLHLCCINNYLPGVQLLLEHGADVNIQDNDLWTPLHVAAACGHKNIAEILLEHNADCTILDVDGNFAYDSSENQDMRDLLLKHMSFNGIYEQDLRFQRSRMAKAMLAAVKECIVRQMDLNILNKNGVTPLHVTAANGYYQAAMLILDLGGAQVDIKDDLGYTPLHVAAKYNQTKLVHLLLSRNAAPNVLSSKLELPIDMTDNSEIIDVLRFVGGDCTVDQGIVVTAAPPLTPTRVQSMFVDLEEFEIPQTKSKSLQRDTPMSKLEVIFEGQTLIEIDNFDDGVDVSIQRPALRRLRGSLVKKRGSVILDLPDPSSTDNLATLSDLTEDIVLKFLRDRYCIDQIYTYIGEILVAINPFKALSVYNNLASQTYSKEIPDPSLPPHVFAVANQIYRSMLSERKPQGCVISGESGAGKTETCKYLVQQLLFITESEEKELNLKIEQVNPILEAFGNARTVMNNNSSRFGKFLELSFSEKGEVLGATFKEYLLEKSRVVSHGKGERNFHIFYQVFAGLSTEEKADLKLDDPNMHRCLTVMRESLEGVLTSQLEENFKEVRDSMEAIGFSKQEENRLLQTLAAIIHICDVTFDPNDEGCRLSNPSLTAVIADFLQIDSEELAQCLVQEAMITRGEQIIRNRTPLQANDCRDALAKALYGRMFGWIVNGINHHLQPENLDPTHPTKIGVLDIFGFENFEKNNFEQMCINVANEQLQHYFNEHIFKWEQEECIKEGVATEAVKYESNWPVVDLFLAKNSGLLALVDEESRFPRATDGTLATKLHKAHGACEGGIYKAPPDMGTKFGVTHYAGHVKYEVCGFLDKNRDTLPPSVLQLLKTSDSKLLREIFGSKLTHTGSITPSKRQRMSSKADSPFSHFNRKASRRMTRISRKHAQRAPPRKFDTGRRAPPTVANHFKNSLSELMDKLHSSSPHFIRCIKPNSSKIPNSFDHDYVTRQLKYVGVMETTRIRQCGFPVRLPYAEFLTRYNVLKEFYTNQASHGPLPDNEAVGVVLRKVGVTGWESGRSKVLLKYNHPVELERHSRNIHLHIISIQRWFREVKAWKLAREALRVRREKARKVKESLASSAKAKTPSPVHKTNPAHHSTETAMSSERSVARNVQEGWNEGLYGNVGDGFGETSRGFAKNSNFNNSRGCSNPEGYILPTSPATRLPPDQNVEEGYVDATEIEEDIYATNPNKGPLTRITSLPSIANDDIIMTSSAPLSLPMIIHEQSIEDIYDTTDSVMQSDVQPDSLVDQDYYNYEDAVDEIYDDTTSLQEEIVRVNTQGTVPKNSPRPNVSQPPEIEEDIYDDTIVSEFRRDYPTSVQDSQNDEIYSDASSVFQQPPPPVLKRTRVNAPLPLPPQPHESVVQLPPQHRRSAVPLPSRETYKQTEVQSPPMPQRTKAHPPPQLPCRKTYKGTAPEHVEEEDNPTYSDAASVFQSLPAQKLSGSSRFPPFPVMESDEQSDVYTYLTELEVDEILSEEPEVNTSSRSSNSKTKVSPPSPSLSVRSPNPSLTTTPEASRRTSSSASLEASPPLPPPRKSSMNCDSDPNAPPLPSRTNFRTPPPSSSPGVQRRVSRQRSRATKTRSTSDPPSPLMSSGFGQLDLPSYFSNPSNHSHRPPSKLLERRKSNDEVFSPPLNVRLSKRFSEPTTHGYVPKQQISRPTVPVLPHRLREEDPSQEDYAEIDECVELDVYETPIAGQPQQYSAPLQRSKPSLNVTQKRNSPPSSPPSNNQKDITPPPLPPVILVGDRPKAPLPSEALMATKFKTSPEKTAPLQNNPPPSKPPRARKVSLGGPAPPAPPTRTAASSVGAPPPPPVRNTPLLETLPRPTATPPAPPVRKRSSNPPASIPPPAPPSRFIPSQALSQSPPGFPPPPPPPPPIGQTKPSPVTQLRSSQTQSSHPSPAAPTDNLLAGIQNLQLRKATEREELQVIPPPSNGGSSGPGNLMAEMKSFKLKKTKDTAPKVTSNVNDSPFHLKTTPSSQAPPVSPHLNSSHQMREKSNSPPTIPSRKANPRSSPPLNGHVTSHDSMSDVSSDNRLPEWKKTLLDKKRREQQQCEQEAVEAKWSGVPEWKRKIMEEKQVKAAAEQQRKGDMRDVDALPEWKRNLLAKKQ